MLAFLDRIIFEESDQFLIKIGLQVENIYVQTKRPLTIQ